MGTVVQAIKQRNPGSLIGQYTVLSETQDSRDRTNALDHWVVAGGFRPVTRAVMLAVVLTLCAGIAIRFIVMPWFRRIHPLYAARMLDKSSEGLEGSLLTLVDLKAAGYPSDTAIHKTLEKRAALKLAEVHIDEVIDRRWLIRMGTALFILTLLTCLYAVISPKSMSLLRPLTLSQTQVATRTGSG